MLIKISSFELEISRHCMFLGFNLARRWRYQTFRDWTGNGGTTTDLMDRKTGSRWVKWSSGPWEVLEN